NTLSLHWLLRSLMPCSRLLGSSMRHAYCGRNEMSEERWLRWSYRLIRDRTSRVHLWEAIWIRQGQVCTQLLKAVWESNAPTIRFKSSFGCSILFRHPPSRYEEKRRAIPHRTRSTWRNSCARRSSLRRADQTRAG